MIKNLRRQLVWSLVIIAGSIALFGSAMLWLSASASDKAKIITLNRTLISRSSQSSETLAELKQNAPAAASYAKLLIGFLPPAEELLNFPRWLDGLARAQQVSLRVSFQGEPVPAREELPGFYRFSADMTGELDNILNLMTSVESRAPRYLVRFENFEYSQAGDQARITSQGKVYFREPPAVPKQ
ncbi:MAG: hypothetical protein HY978_05055 [Candidatus Liptonbacteria bacterium]|nr:hypothetical protein [Candidatus Liptonbacteria bacterium]